MNPSKKLIEVYSLDNVVLVRAKSGGAAMRVDVAQRKATEISAEQIAGLKPQYRTAVEIDAVFGIVALVDESYLVYVKRSKFVAEVLGRAIYQATEMDFVALTSTLRQSGAPSALRSGKDRMFQSLLLSLLNNASFYYSASYDLTNSLQKQSELGFGLQHADHDFLINKPYLVAGGDGAGEYFPPFIHGFVAQSEVALATPARLTLISRKEVARLGTRYYSRGVDELGNASNAVETEQIWEERGAAPRRVFSFVQLRGSIPVFWTQLPTLAYNPRPAIDSRLRSETPYALHFARTMRKYGECLALNLVDRRGWQLLLGREFEQQHARAALQSQDYASKVGFEWFDYHAQCRRGTAPLLALFGRNEALLSRFGQFEAAVDGTPTALSVRVLARQSGVVRTNCVDCLDRTSVAQSFLAARALRSALGGERELPATAEAALRRLWAENADRLSVLYAGTPALKTDVTRNGRRSYRGALKDAKNSGVRYFVNNFYDGERQNVYDFLAKNSIRTHSFYVANNGGNFVRTATFLLFLPIFARFVFWAFGRRMSSLVGKAMVLLALTVFVCFVMENKNFVLQSHISKN